MSNESAQPPSHNSVPDQSTPVSANDAPSSDKQAPGATRRKRAAAPHPRKAGNLRALLIALLLIAAAILVTLLWTEPGRRLTGASDENGPMATIPVAPPPPSNERPSDAQPSNETPEKNAAAPPSNSVQERASSQPPAAESSAPPADLPPAATADRDLQGLKDALAELTARLDTLKTSGETSGALSGERAPAALPDDRVARLEDRLNSLQSRLSALAEQPFVTPSVLADALIETRQAAQMAAQEAAQMAAQQAAQDAARSGIQSALQENAPKLAELERRLADLDRTVAPLAARSRGPSQGEALALGLLALRDALDRGAPYGDLLSPLRQAAAGDAALESDLDQLAATAASGVPTVAMLHQRLSAVPPPPQTAAAPTPTDPPPSSDGFMAGIWQRLSSVVTVQRLDDAADGSDARVDEAIDEAQLRLAFGDPSGAVAAIEPIAVRPELAPAQRTSLEDWLRAARARVTAENSFASLSRRSLALQDGKAAAPTVPPPNDVPATPAPP